MRELVEYIVKNMVSQPDKVSAQEQTNGSEVEIVLSVDPSDMGIVIGKGGQNIKAIRKLLTVRAMAEGVRVYLRLNEPEGSQPEETEADSAATAE